MNRLFATLCFFTVVLSLIGDVQAQSNPNGRLPVATYDAPFLFLIRDPVVHADLRLNVRQIKALRALNDEFDMPLWSMRNKGAKHVAETMRKVTETTTTRLAKILTHDQLDRLNQIEYRTLGMRAFSREDVVGHVAITDDQRQVIRGTLSKTAAAINDLTKQLESGTSRESLHKKATQLRIDEQKQILTQLNRDQKQKWVAMLGKKIDVSRLGRLKLKAPELEPTDDWINSAPLTLEKLQGKVVALHFYAFA